MGRVTDRRRVLRVDADKQASRPDTLVVEEPLEIRVGGEPLTVTMRTPGDDFDLVAGFLATEGVVTKPAELLGMRYCAGKDDEGRHTFNVIDATLAPGVEVPLLDVTRNFYTTSSCGICGKASLEAVRLHQPYDLSTDPTSVHLDVLRSLPDQLRQAQRVFERTGGLHAAGLFDAAGDLVCLREDIGRHNALDKLVGWALRQERLPLAGHAVLLSGRASFELIQKALLAGVPLVAAVSAPSTLAVDLADEAGMTLVGFLRGDTMNVYTHPQRIAGLEAVSPS